MKKIHTILLPLITICVSVLLMGCSSGPYRGRVVDAETMQPIEGAVVDAEWAIYRGGGMGEAPEFYEVRETLTDKNGNYYIPKFVSFNPLVKINWRYFSIYKPGYKVFCGEFNMKEYLVNPPDNMYDLPKQKFLDVVLPKTKDIKEREDALEMVRMWGPYNDSPGKKIPILCNYVSNEEINLGHKEWAK